MKVYSYSEARQRFADVLRDAKREGQAQIRRRDGELFLVQPALCGGSPLDVPGIESRLTARQLVDLVRASRRSTERLLPQTPADKTPQPTSPTTRRRKTKRAKTARG
jgi:antitoxin Phd